MQAATKDPGTIVRVRPPMHRKGSDRGRVTAPKNLQERLIARRLDLNLSQENVATQIKFWNNKRQAWGTLSRSAYCMYESGEVIPDLDKIVKIAHVLECAPEWLAFGIGTGGQTVEEIAYDPDAMEFVPKSTWSFGEGWLDRFDIPVQNMVLCTIDNYTPYFIPGDVALIHRDVSPNRSEQAEFVFVHGDELLVAYITLGIQPGVYRIYDSERRKYREVDADEVQFLGKAIGKICEI